MGSSRSSFFKKISGGMRKKLKIDVLNYIKKGISQTESDVYTKINDAGGRLGSVAICS